MLDKYRDEIDSLDREIISLLDKRFEVTEKVGNYKKENNIPVLNQNREAAIITKLKQLNLKHQSQVIDAYIAIMDISKRQQDE